MTKPDDWCLERGEHGVLVARVSQDAATYGWPMLQCRCGAACHGSTWRAAGAAFDAHLHPMVFEEGGWFRDLG